MKNTMKNRPNKLLLPLESANSNKRKKRCACFVEAHESERKRTKEIQRRDDEDHVVVREFNSLSHYNLVHKPLPRLRAVTIPAAKAAVDKEWDKLKTSPVWRETEVNRKNRSSSRHK